MEQLILEIVSKCSNLIVEFVFSLCVNYSEIMCFTTLMVMEHLLKETVKEGRFVVGYIHSPLEKC